MKGTSQAFDKKRFSVPFSTTSIKLSPQLSGNGFQVHEITETTSSALPVMRRDGKKKKRHHNFSEDQSVHFRYTLIYLKIYLIYYLL